MPAGRGQTQVTEGDAQRCQHEGDTGAKGEHPPVMTPGACAAITAWGRAPRGWARVRAGDTSPGVASVPSTAAPATASCGTQGKPQVTPDPCRAASQAQLSYTWKCWILPFPGAPSAAGEGEGVTQPSRETETLRHLGRKTFSWNLNPNKHPDSRCPEFQ